MGYRRWPCPKCQFSRVRFALICPSCEGLPWDGLPEAKPWSLVRAGSQVEIRSVGWSRAKHRFSTSSGYLGTLTRKLFGHAEWFGVDGREAEIERPGALTRDHLLLEGDRPVAAARIEHFRRGTTIFHAGHRWSLSRTGMLRSDYLLKTETESSVAHLEGGLFAPVRKARIELDLPLPVLVLASYVAARLRQTEVES